MDRPSSPQSEVRIGHVGLRRRIPDYHATIVLTTMLGGLFNSRLQRLLREEKGYTYHVSAGFDFRRSPGPFAVRTAVQTEVTAPAVTEALGVLRRLRSDPPTPAELSDAREFLIGVFPLRFESPEQVAGAIAGLVAQELPDDELDRYRPAVAAVTASDVVAAAGHVRPDEAAIVIVGDARTGRARPRGGRPRPGAGRAGRVIVVVGRPALAAATAGGPDRPAGSVALIALAAAGAGAAVELVGAVGDDDRADALAVALGRAGVGHAALLRLAGATTPRWGDDAASWPRLDAADLDLGLRYVPECRVLVLAEPLPPAVRDVALEAAVVPRRRRHRRRRR